VKKRAGEHGQRPLRVFVLDCEALPLAVSGDRKMIAWFDLAARGEAEAVTSPMTLVEAYGGRTTEQPGSKSPTSGRKRLVDRFHGPNRSGRSPLHAGPHPVQNPVESHDRGDKP
jgi:hypothetical protein